MSLKFGMHSGRHNPLTGGVVEIGNVSAGFFVWRGLRHVMLRGTGKGLGGANIHTRAATQSGRRSVLMGNAWGRVREQHKPGWRFRGERLRSARAEQHRAPHTHPHRDRGP